MNREHDVDDNITVTRKGISIPAALVMAAIGMAGGGGAGTLAANAQTSQQLREAESRINKLERKVDVVEVQTRNTEKNVEELKTDVKEVDSKVSDVLDELRRQRR